MVDGKKPGGEMFSAADASFVIRRKEDSIPESLPKSGIKGRTSEFYEFPENDDVVVRRSYKRPPLEYIPVDRGPDIQGLAEHWSHQTTRLFEIGNKYNIRIARTAYILEHDPENTEKKFSDEDIRLVMITEKIKGENLDKLSEIDLEAGEKIDNLFSSVFQHVYDSYKGEVDYWADFKNSQIVLGTAPNETSKELFIVDVDPEIYPWISEYCLDLEQGKLKKEQSFIWYLGFVYSEQLKLETRFSKQFEKARKTIKEILAKVGRPENTYSAKQYDYINSSL